MRSPWNLINHARQTMRIVALFTLLTLMLAGCETVGGFGQDVEAGGEAISDLSNDVQDDL